MPTYILGISAFYHDSAACLMRDGVILAAAQEERFTRLKHDNAFPAQAIRYCLQEAGISVKDIHYVGFYDKPFLKFERLLLTYLSYAPFGLRSFLKAMPLWLKKKIFMQDLIARELDYQGPILFTEHHEAHAASAFYSSPFHEAAVLTIDGVGEWATASLGVGEGKTLTLLQEINFPHSLGLLYSAFTYYAGFRVNSGEYKLMGLAPYGEPKYVDVIKRELIDIKEDGSFKLNLRYFDYCAGLTMTNRHFHRLFGASARKPETEIDPLYMDVARSVQEVTEEVMLKMARYAHDLTGKNRLCLAGGVALNCVANGRILREGPFEKIWIQPAAGDAGGALGAAQFIWYRYLGHERHADEIHDALQGSYLGPSFDDQTIRQALPDKDIPYEVLTDEELSRQVAQWIAGKKVVGFFAGRMEFGPRALGGRSILGDARCEQMQSIMNLKIKFRESFRPFAPSVMAEKVGEYFDLPASSPYMLLVAPVRSDKLDPTARLYSVQGLSRRNIRRSEIPAVTHVDGSARIQTVTKDAHPLYYAIIQEFSRLTGCPVIINTSFNIRGEPIVCTPQEAYRCFMSTDMDYLVMGHCIFDKKQQPHQEKYKRDDIVQILD